MGKDQLTYRNLKLLDRKLQYKEDPDAPESPWLQSWRNFCTLMRGDYALPESKDAVHPDVRVIVLDTVSQRLLRGIVSRHCSLIKVPKRAVYNAQYAVTDFMGGVVDGGIIALDLATATPAEVQAAVSLCIVRHIPFLAFRGKASPFLMCFATVFHVKNEVELSNHIVEIAEKGHRQRSPLASPVSTLDLPMENLKSPESKFAAEAFLQNVIARNYKPLRPSPRVLRLQAFAIQTPQGYEEQRGI